MKRICIHQPDFVPYLGFFHRLLSTDIYIVLDDVQFIRKGSGWQNRDMIMTSSGPKWLTLSVKKAKLEQKICEVELAENQTKWKEKNLNFIKENYRRSKYFGRYFPTIEEIYFSGYRKMVDLNMEFLNFFFDLFDIKNKIIFSSALNIRDSKTQRLIKLIQKVDGTHYVSGLGSKAYLDDNLFEKNGIILEWQNFQHPIYPQLHGEFTPNLSCIDILFNCGPEAKKILWSCLEQDY